MKKKRVLAILFSFVLALVLCVGMTACGGSDKDQAAEDEQTNIEQEEQEADQEAEELQKLEEQEEALLEAEENAEEMPILTSMKYEDFVGTWETVTGSAEDFFGGYQITFNKDKTFDAVITGEEETGKCTCENGVTTAQNEVVNDRFWFNQDKILVVQSDTGGTAMLQKVK